MRKYLLLAFLAVFLVPIPARSQAQKPGQIEVNPADDPLIITGWLDEPDSFVSNLRLTARNAPVNTFVFLASDLKQINGDERIPRQQLTLVGTTVLTTTNVPRDFQVHVTGLRIPGTYTGTITLLQPDQPQQIEIPLSVVAKARPTLSPLRGTDRVQLQLVNCGWLGCLLSQNLLPKSFFVSTFNLQFMNSDPISITLRNAQAVVIGEKTGYQLGEDAFTLPAVHELSANSIVTMPLTLNRIAIPPDHYSGSIYFTMVNEKAPLLIPVDINVRTGPFWPLVFLLLGIALGRLVKFMQEHGNEAAKKLLAAKLVQSGIQKKASPQDQEFLLDLLQDARLVIYQQEQVQAGGAEINQINTRLHLLSVARQIERLIQSDQSTQTEDIRNKIREIIFRVKYNRNDPDPEKNKTAFIDDANELYDLQRQAEGLTQGTVLSQNIIPTLPPIKDVWREISRDSLRRFNYWLLRDAPKQFNSWLLYANFSGNSPLWLRPLLTIILLFALSIIGLNQIYINNGATFGANPLTDYLTVLLWGLSADVVSRNLSALGGS